MSDDDRDVILFRIEQLEKRQAQIDGYIFNGIKAFFAAVALLLWEPLQTLMKAMGLAK
jgi:hypothetical protein